MSGVPEHASAKADPTKDTCDGTFAAMIWEGDRGRPSSNKFPKSKADPRGNRGVVAVHLRDCPINPQYAPLGRIVAPADPKCELGSFPTGLNESEGKKVAHLHRPLGHCRRGHLVCPGPDAVS